MNVNTDKLIILAIVALAVAILCQKVFGLDYATPAEKYGLEYATIESGETPFPTNAVYPVAFNLKSIPPQYLIIDGGAVREKTQGEKDAWNAAESNAVAQSVTDWKNSKTNHQDIILLDNRFMEVLTAVNASLMAEGLITTNLTPQTMTMDQTAFLLVSMTNQTAAASLSSRLDTVFRYDTQITLEQIGSPPDGKGVLFYIEQH